MQLSTVSDKKDRTRNVIIYGLEESDLENLEEEARRVLAELDDKPVITDCCRVGIRKPDSKRPIKFASRSSDGVKKILRKLRYSAPRRAAVALR